MFGWFESSDSTEASWNATTMTMEQPSHAESMPSKVVTQQPTPESMKMELRGGGICCEACACLACFECCEICC